MPFEAGLPTERRLQGQADELNEKGVVHAAHRPQRLLLLVELIVNVGLVCKLYQLLPQQCLGLLWSHYRRLYVLLDGKRSSIAFLIDPSLARQLQFHKYLPMFPFLILVVEGDKLGASYLTLGEEELIHCLCEQLVHQLWLMPTSSKAYVFLYSRMDSSSFFCLCIRMILSFSRSKKFYPLA